MGTDVSEKHRELHHYTTVGGFEGILQSQSLFSTYYRYLNDRSEVFHLKEKLQPPTRTLLKREIQRLKADPETRTAIKALQREHGSKGTIAREEAVKVLETLFTVTFGVDGREAAFPIYVTSLCSHMAKGDEYARDNGLLSMWNSYGRNGGLALVFDSARLERLVKLESEAFQYNHLGIGDVVYDHDIDGFRDEFPTVVEGFKTVARNVIFNQEQAAFGKDFLKDFLDAASRFKHRAFFEEREVRIVAIPWTEAHYDASKREHESEGKPVGKQKRAFKHSGASRLCLFGEPLTEPLPITRVIVGPHRDQKERAVWAQRLLDKYAPGIQAVCSDTPYDPG